MAIIPGTGGDDVLRGTGSDDVLWGGVGDDDLMGLAGNDRLEGGAGADVLNGGPGADIADYLKSPEGVRVYLDGTAGSGGHAEGDVLTEIEDVWGSRHDDRIFGDGGVDRLFGGGGYDFLEGGPGADLLDGGEDGGYDFRRLGTLRDDVWGDTAGYTQSDAGVTVNLATGTTAGGHAEGDTLRRIENVRGSDHADMLTARDDDPDTPFVAGIMPPEGSILWGQKGDDVLHGGTGRDILWGGKGDDTLLGGEYQDYLEGGAGADVLDGGDGWDFAAYELSDAGVTVDLEAGTASGGHAEGDTLTGIEHVAGSAHADTLTARNGDSPFTLGSFLYGVDGDDTLQGGTGIDYLEGGAGADVLDGGGGFVNTAMYTLSDAGVTIDLQAGTASGGHAEGDTLTGIQEVRGSDFDDRLTGDAGSNSFEGRAGADVLDGGDGWDRASYWNSDAGVTVDLAAGTAQGGHAEGDTLTGIERVAGSRHADHLIGDDGNNWLDGGAGADTLNGGAGNDWLVGGAGADALDGGADWDSASYRGSDAGVTVNLATGTGQGGHAEGDTLTGIEAVQGSDHDDTLTGDDGNNFLRGGAGADSLTGGDNNDNLKGGAGADTLTGGDGDDWLEGTEGADTLTGGAGWDWAQYWGSDAGVTVNLATGTGQGGHAEGDTLTGIEAVYASAHDDTLTGDDGNNLLRGGAGADALTGGDGDDQLDGGDGADTLNGGAGADTLTGGGDADTFVFGDSDTVTDFQDGSDLIDITDFDQITDDSFGTDVAIQQSGDDVEIQIGDAVLTLSGVDADDITADDFILA